MKNVELCTTIELSKIFGISPRKILELVAKGMPKIKRNQYNLEDCFIWYRDKGHISEEEYSLRATRINLDLVGKKRLQIAQAYGKNNPNRDNNGRLNPSPKAWELFATKTFPETQAILRTKK